MVEYLPTFFHENQPFMQVDITIHGSYGYVTPPKKKTVCILYAFLRNSILTDSLPLKDKPSLSP